MAKSKIPPFVEMLVRKIPFRAIGSEGLVPSDREMVDIRAEADQYRLCPWCDEVVLKGGPCPHCGGE